ncbi:Uncharacterised protein [Mycobacteroides abscessus subsp. abscessus]|nr:Uncharacterised protein [Mycobacteroides abscessus subsp. abscessus]
MMKIILTVGVTHNGTTIPNQTVDVDVNAPGDDTLLDPWFNTELAPHILTHTTATPGDDITAEVRQCDNPGLPQGLRFTIRI